MKNAGLGNHDLDCLLIIQQFLHTSSSSQNDLILILGKGVKVFKYFWGKY